MNIPIDRRAMLMLSSAATIGAMGSSAMSAIPNGEHGLGGGDPKLIDNAYKSALEFVNKHMR